MRFFLAIFLLLAGCASQPPEHYVDLAWPPSPTPGVLYRLYRADCGNVVGGICIEEGTFSVIANSLSGLTYHDATVAGGMSYSYRVTATLGSEESPPSPSVGVTIP